MSGEMLGRRLLRLDAAYCAIAGVIAAALFLPLARFFGTPPTIPAVTGMVAVVWALILVRLARLGDWRRSVMAVAAANLVAAAALVALAGLAPSTGASLLLTAVAVEVAAFAAGQVAALTR